MYDSFFLFFFLRISVNADRYNPFAPITVGVLQSYERHRHGAQAVGAGENTSRWFCDQNDYNVRTLEKRADVRTTVSVQTRVRWITAYAMFSAERKTDGSGQTVARVVFGGNRLRQRKWVPFHRQATTTTCGHDTIIHTRVRRARRPSASHTGRDGRLPYCTRARHTVSCTRLVRETSPARNTLRNGPRSRAVWRGRRRTHSRSGLYRRPITECPQWLLQRVSSCLGCIYPAIFTGRQQNISPQSNNSQCYSLIEALGECRGISGFWRFKECRDLYLLN